MAGARRRDPSVRQSGTRSPTLLTRVLLLAGAVLLVVVSAVPAQDSSRDVAVEAMRIEQRVALIIGNGAYPISVLRNPVNDARAMARALRTLGFEVLAHENLGEKACGGPSTSSATGWPGAV